MEKEANKKKRIVVKIGSNSLLHPETGNVNYNKIDRLARELCDLKNQGMDVCLVSSGAIAVGRQCIGYDHRPTRVPEKQALASVGQARLMGIYQKIFAEYNQQVGQVLMTKATMIDNVSRKNAQNTFEELFSLDIIPIVNENDTISTYEIKFGDNDTLSAIVASLINADTLVLLSDIDGLFTADPKEDPSAKLIPVVEKIDENLRSMASETPGSDVGTGGMVTKIRAASIVNACGGDMIIANGADVSILGEMFAGEFTGTVFKADYDEYFDIIDFLENDLA